MDWLTEHIDAFWQGLLINLGSPELYVQVGAIAVSLLLAWILAALLKARLRLFRDEPQSGTLYNARAGLHGAGSCFFRC